MWRAIAVAVSAGRYLDHGPGAHGEQGGAHVAAEVHGVQVPAEEVREGAALALRAQEGPRARGLHSSTFRLNVCAFCWIGVHLGDA